VPEDTSLAAFCESFPLGSTERVIALDGNGRYAGVVLVADAHHALAHLIEDEPQIVAVLLRYPDTMLLPSMSAKDAAELFAASNSEELAVVDNAERRRVIGLLTEAYLLRRYAEELDKGWKDLTGESA
jgi:CIC family chloride channel protein